MTPSKQVSGDSVVDVLRDTEKPYATTTDIAEGLDVTAQTIRNNAGELSQDPRINKGSVGQSSVYWLADSNSPPEGVAGDPGPPEPPDQRGATEPEPERDTNDSKGILNRLFASSGEGMEIPVVVLFLLTVVLPLLAIRQALDVVIDKLTATAEVHKTEPGFQRRAWGITGLSVILGLSVGVVANVVLLDPLPLAVRAVVSALLAFSAFFVLDAMGLYLNARTRIKAGGSA